MKKFSYPLLYTFFLLVGSVMSCKDSDKPVSEQELAAQKLVGSWTVGQQGTVFRDNFRSEAWADFTITFTENSYTTTNTVEAVWPKQGSWTFAQGMTSKLDRGNGIICDVLVTADRLELQFTQPEGRDGGRILGTLGEPGQYRFTLVRK